MARDKKRAENHNHNHTSTDNNDIENNDNENNSKKNEGQLAAGSLERVNDTNAIGKTNLMKSGDVSKSDGNVADWRILPPVGLKNLGNTCYFNSVLQCLYCMPELGHERIHGGRVNKSFSQFFSRYKITSRKNIQGKAGYFGSCDAVVREPFNAHTQLLQNDLKKKKKKRNKKMLKKKSKLDETVSSTTISPSQLLNEIGKKASWLRGFQQQDAHELLRCLIDILDTEQKKFLIKRKAQTALSSTDCISNSDTNTPNNSRSDMTKIRNDTSCGSTGSENHNTLVEVGTDAPQSMESSVEMDSGVTSVNGKKNANASTKHLFQQTLINTTFGAALASQLTCLTCGHKSQRIERCADISLQLPGSSTKLMYAKKTKKNDKRKGSKKSRRKRNHKMVSQTKSTESDLQTLPDQISRIQLNRFRQGLTGKGSKLQRKKAAKERRAAKVRAKMEAVHFDCNEKITHDSQDTISRTHEPAKKSSTLLSAKEYEIDSNKNRSYEPDKEIDSNKQTEAPTSAKKISLQLPPSLQKNVLSFGASKLECIEEIINEILESIKSRIITQCTTQKLNAHSVNGQPHIREDLLFQMPDEPNISLNKGDTCSLYDCLTNFTSSEMLNVRDGDGILCDNCGGDALHDAQKRMVFHKLPEVLVVHLKRFSSDQFGLTSKINKTITYPSQIDMLPYCTKEATRSQSQIMYSLFGIVSHIGSMRGGHYIAIVKRFRNDINNPNNRTKAGKDGHEEDRGGQRADAGRNGHWSHRDEGGKFRWYQISDSQVQEVTEKVALNTQAFLLFYRKINC